MKNYSTGMTGSCKSGRIIAPQAERFSCAGVSAAHEKVKPLRELCASAVNNFPRLFAPPAALETQRTLRIRIL
jgi:hypothetical protein